MKTTVEFSRNLFEILLIIKRFFRDEVNESYRKTKLTLAQYRILIMICHDLNQVSKMAEEVGISQPAMSKAVDALVEAGLIRRTAHPTDRRQIILQITAKAEQLLKAIEEGLCKRIDAHLRHAKESDLKMINTATVRMLELLRI